MLDIQVGRSRSTAPSPAWRLAPPIALAMLLLAAPAGAPPARAGAQAIVPAPLAQPLAPTVYRDIFPQDLNNYRVGGWRDLVSGDGTGGTVTATFDSSAIYMDGTVNALAYAVRNTPDARDFEMTLAFTVVNEQMTTDDHLRLLLRFKDPVYPTGCCFGGAGQVHATSGVAIDFNLGRGIVTPYREKNGSQDSALAPPTPVSFGFGIPHQMKVGFLGVNLAIDLDGVPLARWRVPNFAPGRIGLEVYRLDITVADIGLTTQ